MAHIRQSSPDYGLSFQVQVPETFNGVPSSLGWTTDDLLVQITGAPPSSSFCNNEEESMQVPRRPLSLKLCDKKVPPLALPQLIDSGRGTARADDAQGTPTQSQISPSILVYEENLGPP